MTKPTIGFFQEKIGKVDSYACKIVRFICDIPEFIGRFFYFPDLAHLLLFFIVWGSSISAVIVISISGLVVVALVPLMSRKIYNVVTQFLIALSVGSLIGDAFLHLIPHVSLQHSIL